MELEPRSSIYDGEQTEIKYPTQRVIKNAILNLDFTSGALTNQEIAEQLATQFCLSEKQRNATRPETQNVRTWNGLVNGVIQDLASNSEIVRPMRATNITPDALNSLVKRFLVALRYEPNDVEVRDKDNDNINLLIQIDTKTQENEGKTFIIDVTP